MTDPETPADSPIAASVHRLRNELDRWMDVAMNSGGKALNVLGIGQEHAWRPEVDVIESPEHVWVLVNVPGANPDDIHVSLAGNMLTVKGETIETPLSDNDFGHVMQRKRGAFERSIPMPVPVDPDHVSAEARYGVLRIQLGKSERAKSRQIKIRPEDQPRSEHPPPTQ